MKKDTVCVISLGCPKNLVDTEHLIYQITKLGLKIEPDPTKAEKVLINTCGFIEDAVRESIQVILNTVQNRQYLNSRGLLVYGCMVQRYGKALKALLPEVEAWFGVGQVQKLLSHLQGKPINGRLERPRPLDYLNQRVICTPPHTAYLKVAEGCNNACSFCIIPKIRGRLRSYPIKDLVEETKRILGERDLKELVLIAQDLTQYGMDLGLDKGLIRLLENLLKLEGPPWIRLMYLNPWGVESELLSLLEREHRICPYLDLPIQHINDSILRLMGRSGKEAILKLLHSIRSLKREIAIRTTLMVGFPTETDQQFEELYDFVTEYRFHHLGAFIYSPEKGTKAERLLPKVKRSIAKKRLKKIMSAQSKISKQLNERLIGKELEVLVEGAHPDTEHLLVGRTSTMAPEIDGQVIINRGVAKPGEFKVVRVTEAFEYDIVGEIVE